MKGSTLNVAPKNSLHSKMWRNPVSGPISFGKSKYYCRLCLETDKLSLLPFTKKIQRMLFKIYRVKINVGAVSTKICVKCLHSLEKGAKFKQMVQCSTFRLMRRGKREDAETAESQRDRSVSAEPASDASSSEDEVQTQQVSLSLRSKRKLPEKVKSGRRITQKRAEKKEPARRDRSASVESSSDETCQTQQVSENRESIPVSITLRSKKNFMQKPLAGTWWAKPVSAKSSTGASPNHSEEDDIELQQVVEEHESSLRSKKKLPGQSHSDRSTSAESSSDETVKTRQVSRQKRKTQRVTSSVSRSLSSGKKLAESPNSVKNTRKRKRQDSMIPCPEPSCDMTFDNKRGVEGHMRLHKRTENGSVRTSTNGSKTDNETEESFVATDLDETLLPPKKRKIMLSSSTDGCEESESTKNKQMEAMEGSSEEPTDADTEKSDDEPMKVLRKRKVTVSHSDVELMTAPTVMERIVIPCTFASCKATITNEKLLQLHMKRHEKTKEAPQPPSPEISVKKEILDTEMSALSLPEPAPAPATVESDLEEDEIHFPTSVTTSTPLRQPQKTPILHECEIWHAKFRLSIQLRKHRIVHETPETSEDTTVQCQLCLTILFTEEALDQHINLVHNKPGPKSSKSIQRQTKAFAVNYNNNTWLCCSIKFNDGRAFFAHKSKEHPEVMRKLACLSCRSPVDRENMDRHVEIKHGGRHECVLCGIAYSSREEHHNHIQYLHKDVFK